MGAASIYPNKESVKSLRSIQKPVFLLFPYESFTHTLINFQMATQTNARCKRLPNEYYETRCGSGSPDPCCGMNCRMLVFFVTLFYQLEWSLNCRNGMLQWNLQEIYKFLHSRRNHRVFEGKSNLSLYHAVRLLCHSRSHGISVNSEDKSQIQTRLCRRVDWRRASAT